MEIRKIESKPKRKLRKRWTVLDVDERAIRKVLKYSDVHNKKAGDALSEIILEALSE